MLSPFKLHQDFREVPNRWHLPNSLQVAADTHVVAIAAWLSHDSWFTASLTPAAEGPVAPLPLRIAGQGTLQAHVAFLPIPVTEVFSPLPPRSCVCQLLPFHRWLLSGFRSLWSSSSDEVSSGARTGMQTSWGTLELRARYASIAATLWVK